MAQFLSRLAEFQRALPACPSCVLAVLLYNQPSTQRKYGMLKTLRPDDISALDHGKSRTLEKYAVLQRLVGSSAASSRRSHVSVVVGHARMRKSQRRRVIHVVIHMARKAEVKALRTGRQMQEPWSINSW